MHDESPRHVSKQSPSSSARPSSHLCQSSLSSISSHWKFLLMESVGCTSNAVSTNLARYCCITVPIRTGTTIRAAFHTGTIIQSNFEIFGALHETWRICATTFETFSKFKRQAILTFVPVVICIDIITLKRFLTIYIRSCTSMYIHVKQCTSKHNDSLTAPGTWTSQSQLGHGQPSGQFSMHGQSFKAISKPEEQSIRHNESVPHPSKHSPSSIWRPSSHLCQSSFASISSH